MRNALAPLFDARPASPSVGAPQGRAASSRKKDLRVIVFSPLFPEYAMRLAASLAKHVTVRLITDRAGYEAECGSWNLGGTQPAAVDSRLYSLFVRRSGMLATIGGIARAMIAMWSFKPNIVHFQECPNYAHYLLILLMKPFAKVVVTVHDPLPHSGRDSEVDRPATRNRIRAAADLLLAHGNHCCRELERLTGASGGQVRETAHGAVLCPPPELLREPVPGRVLFFGRMERYKGVAVLLDAADLLIKRGVPLSVHLAGRGPELDRLASRCRGAAHINIREGFLTPLEAIQEFQEASVVALPYHDATQSGVTAAAFANGRPVVASRIGGLSDVVIDGTNGLLVEPGQPEALADALQKLLSSRKLLSRLRRGAANTATTAMDWDSIASRTAGYYEQLIERSHSRQG